MDIRSGSVQERREAYLAKAAEAERIAESSGDPNARGAWQQIALSWRQLAEQIGHSKL
jgi:hypothetical protein